VFLALIVFVVPNDAKDEVVVAVVVAVVVLQT